MYKSYKVELKPTEEQKVQINKTIGVCRFIYNFYLAHNKEIYEKEKRFVGAYEFSGWLNNIFLKQHIEYKWIKEVCSHSVIRAMVNAETAFKRFFKHKAGFPKFKKKNQNNTKAFFPKQNVQVERHRIKIPKLKWVRLKQYGYIPTNANIRSGTISIEAGRYFVSVLVEVKDIKVPKATGQGIGIDLGVKDLAICSNGKTYKNINHSNKIKKLEKSIKRQQRKLQKKIKKNERRSNVDKNKLRLQRLYYRLSNIRKDYTNKVVSEIVKTKPSYITIEDLNIKGMMRNRHLSKAIQNQNLYYFRTQLTNKCKWNGIELRIANRFYPSSKMCNHCGTIKKDLTLKDRVYKCDCGYEVDRDYNASCNLRDCKDYKVA